MYPGIKQWRAEQSELEGRSHLLFACLSSTLPPLECELHPCRSLICLHRSLLEPQARDNNWRVVSS